MAQEASGRVFARQATGLVREVSPLSAAIFNFSNAPVGLVLVYSTVLGFGFFAGGNILLGITLAIIGSIPVLLNYALLTASMPRTGGDYVYSSRLLHPAVGFAANFGLAVYQIIGAGAVATFVALTGVSPAFATLANITGNSGFQDVAEWSATTHGSFIIGAATLTLLAGLMIRGTRTALRFNSVMWSIGLFSLLLMFFILATTSQGEFVSQFNGFAQSSADVSNGYNSVISTAREAGFGERGSLSMLWPLIAVGMLGSGWFFWSTYISGEIKGARHLNRQLKVMLSGAVVNGLMLLLGTWLFIKTFGSEFLSAMTWLLFNAPDEVPFFTGQGAHIVFFSGLSANNDLLATLFVITFIAWTWPLLPCYLFGVVRCAFAWSFDQITPSGLSQVNEKTHTPVRLIVIVWALAVVACAVTAYTQLIYQIFASTFIGTAVYSMLITAVCAVVFPFRGKEIFESSPIAKYRVGRVPLITVTGVLAILFTVFWGTAYIYFPEFGMHENQGALTLVFIGSFVVGLIIYFIGRTIRTRQGIPMDLVFAQVPPE
ncbi:MAG: amino acid permease [Actinomycetota bacterium]|nr:amino acid permease [Actinomycetota bacterium]